jgi:chemotaxis protein MotB
MFDEAPAKKVEEGLPAWVMTFADLMSLLMCFFVLLLSFSELDVSKYKEMAGSMKNAFGVQRDIKVKEPPKGINVIAREFSPGRPEPTIMNSIRQMTTQDLQINLDLGKERRRPVPTPKSMKDPNKTTKFKPHDKAVTTADQKPSEKSGDRARMEQSPQSEGLTEKQKEELEKAKALAEKRLMEKLKLEGQMAILQGKQKSNVAVVDKSLEDLVKAKVESERRKKLENSARLISSALGREIKDGSVDVETAGKKIIIRVREKASFGSGQASLKGSFRPILAKVAAILKDSEGKIIVAGHTDNIPIYTERFRSNWELSSARAVSVAHEMMLATNIPSNRFLIQGFADTEPMAANDTPANRAKNRRVEIILQQGEDKDGKDIGVGDVQGGSGKPVKGKPVALPTTPVTPQTKSGQVPPKKPADAAPKKPAVVKGIRTGGVKKTVPETDKEKTSTPSPGLGIKLGGSK